MEVADLVPGPRRVSPSQYGLCTDGAVTDRESRERSVQEEEPTCGRGLAQNMEVPTALAAVAAGMAQNLEVHMRMLSSSDAVASQERRVYERVVRSLRSAAADLQGAAAEMASAASLPMGDHDMAAVAMTDVARVFEGYVAAEDDLRELLSARRADHEQMLLAMRTEIASPDG